MQNFWKDRNVLITGHTGFKGAWLTSILLGFGAKVTAISLEPEIDNSLHHLLGHADQIDNHYGNINDPGLVDRVMSDSQPEFVFHLAAQALVRPSYEDPIETYETNVMGSLRVLEAIRQAPSVQSVVMVTTDKCYENHEWLWPYRENDQLGGHDPYSSSKACTEILVSSYVRSYAESLPATRISTARAGNVIGGGDWAADRLVPDIFRSIVANEPVQIRNPQATRPWQHVLEPVFGYLLLAQEQITRPELAGAWNFGPDPVNFRRVRDVVELVRQRVGDDVSWQLDSAPQPHEAANLLLDCTKARTQLNWIPVFSVEDAIDATVRVYECCLTGERLQQEMTAQIEGYLNERYDTLQQHQS